MNKEPTLYVAYGSNMNLPQVALRCPTTEVVATSELKDFEPSFRGNRGSTVATVEPKGGSSVLVLLWKIRGEDKVSLDRYEGYPHFYDKQRVKIELDGKVVSAMVYIMTPGHELGVSSDWYADVVWQGYGAAGPNMQVLTDAIGHAWELFAEQRQSRLQSIFGMGGWERRE